MSERLEQWKAREKIRTDIGWAAVWIGLFGLLMLAGGIAKISGSKFVGGSSSTSWPVALAIGVALVLCAVGLWNAKAWARWSAAALFLVLSVGGLLVLVRERSFGIGLPFFLFAAVYLLLPSTGQRFARTRGARPETI